MQSGDFQGCRLKFSTLNVERSYCFVCRVRVEFDADRIANLKKIKDIINKFHEIKISIQRYDPTCNNFWIYHYSTSWVDRFDRFRWKYLKDYIDTYDICFKDW